MTEPRAMVFFAKQRIAELEAQCAAMREAWLKERDWFERANKSMAARSEVSDGLMFQWPQIHDASQRALATDAGKAMLERLEKAEAQRYQEITPEFRRVLLASSKEALVAEIENVRNMLGRALVQLSDARAQALEGAAKVVEAMAEKEEGYLADHGIDIARAIRALKEK